MSRLIAALGCCLAICLGGCELAKLDDATSTTTDDTAVTPTSDVSGDVEVQGQDVNSGIGGGEAKIPNSNDPLVGQMYMYAASCGYLRPSTVPVGWTSVLATSSGCSVYRPASWVVSGQADQVQILDSTSGYAGWFTTAGPMPGTDWTVATATASALKSIGDNVGSQAVQKYYKEYELFGIKGADVVFSITVANQSAAAFMRVLLSEPNYILGTTTGTFIGFYMPQAQMQIYMCDLLQIDASLTCPAGGGGSGCSDSDCNTACQQGGYSGGECATEDCSCY